MKPIPLSLLSLCCFFISSNLLFAEAREWTLPGDKKVSGELKSIANGTVTIIVPGRSAPVLLKVSELSKEDREFVSKWRPETAKPPVTAKPNTPAGKWPQGTNSNVERDQHGWPQVVALKAQPEITTFEENAAENRFIYRSNHFEFIAPERLSQEIVREFSRMFETTYETIAALPLRLEPQPPAGWYPVQLFSTESDYMKGGGLPGSAGVYRGGTGDVLVPLPGLGLKKTGNRWTLEDRKGNTTLIHEITHQVMGPWLGSLPTWIVEGAAEYVAAARYGPGRLTLRGHGGNLIKYAVENKGVRSREVTMRDLETLMTMDHPTWNNSVASGSGLANYYSSMIAFFYFANRDADGSGTGLIDYFAARRKERGRENDETERAEFLMRGRDWAALQKEMEKGLAAAGVRVEWPKEKKEKKEKP